MDDNKAVVVKEKGGYVVHIHYVGNYGGAYKGLWRFPFVKYGVMYYLPDANAHCNYFDPSLEQMERIGD